MKKHPCPRCGKQTEGSYSEAGILWAICEDCMNDDIEKAEARRCEDMYYKKED